MSFFRYEGRFTHRHWIICGFLFVLGLAWTLTIVLACIQASENDRQIEKSDLSLSSQPASLSLSVLPPSPSEMGFSFNKDLIVGEQTFARRRV